MDKQKETFVNDGFALSDADWERLIDIARSLSIEVVYEGAEGDGVQNGIGKCAKECVDEGANETERFANRDDVLNDSATELPIHDLMSAMLTIIIEGTPDEFVDFVQANNALIMEAAAVDETVTDLVILGYKKGVQANHGPSANNLGALYYLGELVEQNYQKAAEYYQLASNWGEAQATVNLGYIYEYGRIGEPDYGKAYMYYSLAASLSQNSEALYKMGDLFNRGKPFGKDERRAFDLWFKSFNRAEGDEELAQPAIRIAPLLLNGKEEIGIQSDPLEALRFFSIAEVGLRKSIASGLTYYRGRLAEAIKGQQAAREMLDAR